MEQKNLFLASDFLRLFKAKNLCGEGEGIFKILIFFNFFLKKSDNYSF